VADEELKRLLEENAAETREHFDGAVERIEARFDDAAARQAEESRRHFVATAERIEKRFDTLAETVEHLDQRLAREAADVRDEMRRGFAETQAMIKFSHVEHAKNRPSHLRMPSMR
jgi:acyl-CoA reductase-like NAD-dependent aldehyde dehydrogenase